MYKASKITKIFGPNHTQTEVGVYKIRIILLYFCRIKKFMGCFFWGHPVYTFKSILAAQHDGDDNDDICMLCQ